jgi:hypothetical protein
LISSAPVAPDPSRLSGLTCSSAKGRLVPPVLSLVYALHPGRPPPADLEQLEDDVGGGFRDEVRDVETPRQGSPKGVKQDALG